MAVAVLLLAAPSFAQQSPEISEEAPPASGEVANLRARWGLSLRSGGQEDLGPGLTYRGMTPNDLAVSGTYYGPWVVGAAAGLQREGFGLFSSAGRVTQGSLLRAHLAAASRVPIGPVRVDAMLGYSFAQLPLFGSSVDPRFDVAARHALLLAARAQYELSVVTLEAKVEVPMALLARDSLGLRARTTGFAAGAGVLYTLLRDGSTDYSLSGDYQLVSDAITANDGTVSAQMMQRVGLALEVRWGAPAPIARTGGLLVSVVDAATGKPLSGVKVILKHSRGEKTLISDAAGKAAIADLDPQQLVARAAVGGYEPVEAKATIVAGLEGRVQLRAKKAAAKTGSLVITVLDRDTSKPLQGVVVLVRSLEHTTNESGEVTVSDLPVGPVQIMAHLSGYRGGQEVASVLYNKTVPVRVLLGSEKVRTPASITGLVRSTRGGKPVVADLEIPQLNLKTKANAKGAFAFKLEGGTYDVVISAPGFLTQSKTVTVNDGDQAIFNVDLHPR